MYNTNRLSSINPDKADIVRRNNDTLSAIRESTKVYNRFLEENKSGEDVVDLYKALSENDLTLFESDIEQDMYIDSLDNKFVNEAAYIETIKSDIIERADKAKEYCNKLLSDTTCSVQTTITDMIISFKSIEDSDRNKHSKLYNIAKNFSFAIDDNDEVIVLKYRPEFDKFPGICNFRFYGPNTKSALASLSSITNDGPSSVSMDNADRESYYNESIKRIDDIADDALATYDLWKLSGDDAVIIGYSDMLKSADGYNIKTGLDTLCDKKDAVFKAIDAAVETNDNTSYTSIVKARDYYSTICKIYLYSINKFRLVHTELFSANRSAFLCLTRYLSMKDSYDINESNTTFLNSGAYIRNGIKFADTVANEYELLTTGHFNNYISYCKEIGLSEMEKLINTGDIVYEAADVEKLVSKTKGAFDKISKSIDKFYDKQTDKFKKLQDKKVVLSKDVINALSDDFKATTHEFFDIKALSYVDRAIKCVNNISDIFTKAVEKSNLDIDTMTILNDIYSNVSGIKDITSIWDLKKSVRNNLTGNSIDIDKQWIISNSKEISKIIENDSYTDTVIKAIKDADTKLFESVYKKLDAINDEKYTDVITKWTRGLVEIVNTTHICYSIALDVYRREFVEYRNIVVKAIKANK